MPDQQAADGPLQPLADELDGLHHELGAGHPARYRVLEVVRDRHDYDVDDLGRRLRTALQAFPSLTGETITVARDDPDRDDRTAAAWPYSRLILVRDQQYMSNVTLYHELAHVAIRVRVEQGESHPTTSEEYCSLFAMARMPPEAVDESSIPYIGEPGPGIDRSEYPERCQQALAYREDNHDYIQQARRLLAVSDHE